MLVDSTHPRWVPSALVLLTVAALVTGGWMLAEEAKERFPEPPTPWPFVVLAVAVVGLLAVTRGENMATPVEPALCDPPPPRWIPAAALAFGAIGLSVAVLIRIPLVSDHESFAPVFAGWLVACVSWVAAVWCFSPPVPARPERQPGRHDWPIIGLVTVIVLGALALRITAVDTIPFTVGGDEASQGLEAVKVLDGEMTNPFSTGWYSVPTMSFFFQALTIGPLGRTIFALRLPWVLVGTASVLTTFFLARRMAGRWTAAATALAVAAYHYHIHYSRLGSNQIVDTLVVSSVLLFVLRALDGTRWRLLDWAAAGAISALGFFWYAGARLTAVVAVAMVVYHFLRAPRRLTRRHGTGLLTAALTFSIFAAPMLQYSVRFPNEFNGRINQVGIFQSGWLEREVEILDQGAGAILFDQFLRASLAFNYYPDRRVWYGLEEPLLDPVFGALFLLGLGYSLVAVFVFRGQKRLAPMVAWWWAGMLLGGMLTESPPSSQRLITLAVPTCFLIVLALQRLLAAVRRTVVPRLPVDAAVLSATALFAVTSVVSYFVHYTPQRIYGGQHAELATTIAPILNLVNDTHDVVFLGTPVMYWTFSTNRYLAPDVVAAEIDYELAEPPPDSWRRPGRGLIVYALPHRTGEIDHVRRTFPDGRLRHIRSEGSRHGLLALEYAVPPAP
jgi:hypothetical protein